MFNRITFILILITFAAYAAGGYLQNEDFKTESELLTAGGSKSQLLNDTKVYVTGNGINKTLDDAIVDGDIGAGGGGSAGINFITDASFEKETFAPTVSVAGGTVTYPTYTTNDKLYSEFNTKYYQIAHTGLSSANYSVNYSQARTGLDGKQGLFSIWAKVNADLDLCIELDASGNCESTVSLIADDTWRKYEIPFVFGASSVEFNFFNASLTGDITLQLDKAYIGTIPDGYIKQINSSELVRVRARKVNSQTLIDAVSSNIIYDDEVEDNYNAYNSTTGVFTCPKISKYRIGFNAYFQNLDSAGNTSTIELTVGSDSYALGRDRTVTNTIEHSSPPFDFECTSIGQTVIPKATCDNTDNSNCNLRPSSGSVYYNTLSITELSNTEYDTIVAQQSNSREIILNAQANANQSISDETITVATNWSETKDTANIFDPATGTITIPEDGYYSGTLFYRFDSESPDKDYLYCIAYFRKGASSPGSIWRNSESSSVTSPGTQTRVSCNVNIEAEYLQAGDKIYTAVFQDNQDGDANNLASGSDSQFLSFYKVETSRTIIGKFEQIKDDTIGIAWNTLASQSYTGGTGNVKVNYPVANLATNNGGITFDDTNDRFVITKAGYYNITIGAGEFDAGNIGLFSYLAQNGTVDIATRCGAGVANTTAFHCTFKKFANVGDYFEHYIGGTGGSLIYQNLRFQIQELPDTESIIKNLSQEKTTCMTKVLNTSVTANGTSDNGDPSYIAALDDIEFNNLTVGKKYRVYFHGLLTASSDSSIVLKATHNGTTVASQACGNSVGVSQCKAASIGDFTASTTSLFFETSGFSTTSQILYGNGTPDFTSARLCELPSTYVETTEW